jgi:glycosyltransferase involved in cell wall biosynthesis
VTDALRLSLDVSAVPADPAGAGQYTLGLAGALAERTDVQLTLVSRSEDAERWERLAPNASVEAVAPAHRPVRLAWEQTGLPRRLRKLPVEVHHGPHYTMPEASKLPRVVTIHDLTYFDHPEWHRRSRVPFFRRAIRVAARHAEALVCVSARTAERLSEICPASGPVHVVPHGVDHQRFRPQEAESGADEAALVGLGINAPYVAFVGTLEPRKDVRTLVRAFDRMCAAHGDLSLVVAGGIGWGTGAVDRAIAEVRHPERIVRPGYVADAVVPALLRQAAAVAYPSLEEGFGLPALEALACGAPLVTTTGSAMQEVVQGAAVLVTPGDVDGLAGALDLLVRRDDGLSARRTRGLAVAARHNWAASAAGHLTAYRAAIARGKHSQEPD